MLRIYSIPIRNDNSAIHAQSDILNDLLPFIIPWTFWSDTMEDYNQSNNMLDYFTLGGTNQCNISRCYFTSKSPGILDWIKLYMNDNDNNTDMILKTFKNQKKLNGLQIT